MMQNHAQGKFTKSCVSSFSTMKSIKLEFHNKQSTVKKTRKILTQDITASFD